MKPTVFLSHSKQDRQLIERLAADLRDARISVWYDEWEIPPGASFRRQIFEIGIPESDLFFVYLTRASAESYWVARELDAAFIHDAETRGGILGVFVDSDQTRRLLPSDLRALHSPVLNNEQYERALRQLIARAWEGLLKRQTRVAQRESQLRTLELEKTIAQLEAQVARLQATGAREIETVLANLSAICFELPEGTVTLRDLYPTIAHELASGAWLGVVENAIKTKLALDMTRNLRDQVGITGRDCLAHLIILRLATVRASGADNDDFYYLTDLGTSAAVRLSGYEDGAISAYGT